MLELEVYAAGVRDLNKILELDIELGPIAGLHYKVDRNHDIVYMELEAPTVTFREIRSIFRKLGLDRNSSGRSRRSCGRRPRPSYWTPSERTAMGDRNGRVRYRCRTDRHSRMFRFITALGRRSISWVIYVGDVMVLAGETFSSAFAHRIRWRLFLQQIVEIGLRSQLVVMITGAFTGAVFAAQTYFQFNKLGMGSAVGAVVSVSVCRELGPVLTALMVTGRVGASMSAEIGTMKVTEQIDALRALAVHPIDYLVVPRALAMMVSMPLLVAECVGDRDRSPAISSRSTCSK